MRSILFLQKKLFNKNWWGGGEVSPPPTRNRVNKADWPKFTNITEDKFQRLLNQPIPRVSRPPNIYRDRKLLEISSIKQLKALSLHGGHIKDVLPEIPTEPIHKIKRKDELRNTNPESPDLAPLNREIVNEISSHRNTKWREKNNNIKCSSKLFKLAKHLNGKNETNTNEAIKFKGKYISTAYGISCAFNKQYSSIVLHKSSKTSRNISKEIKKNKLDNATTLLPNRPKKPLNPVSLPRQQDQTKSLTCISNI